MKHRKLWLAAWWFCAIYLVAFIIINWATDGKGLYPATDVASVTSSVTIAREGK